MGVEIVWFGRTGKASIRDSDTGDWWCGDSNGWVHETSSHWQAMNCGPVPLCQNELFDNFTKARNYALNKGWLQKTWKDAE